MQPKIYTLDAHKIPHEKIDHHVYYIIEKLKQCGFSAYLVGGSVRDLLLNQKPKDFDISTSARPEEIKRIFKNSIIIGRRFKLVHVRFGKKVIEVATFRSGDTEESSIILHDNIWGNEEEDVLRRDFTINGLFYDPKTETVIDYVNGFEDIEKKIIRSIGTAKLRFIQDPVRMIRLLKFKARFGFDVEDKTMEALLSCKDEIRKSSQARIFEELLRMLESCSANPFFRFLNDFGLLKILLPKISKHPNEINTLYLHLESIDLIQKQIYPKLLDRAILLCAFIFPILQAKIKKEFIEKEKPFHLGIIYEEAHKTIHEVFHPFFKMSKGGRAEISSIIANQYRIEQNKPKIVKDPFFHMAFQFFKVRCAIYPDLLKTFELWDRRLHLQSTHVDQ